MRKKQLMVIGLVMMIVLLAGGGGMAAVVKLPETNSNSSPDECVKLIKGRLSREIPEPHLRKRLSELLESAMKFKVPKVGEEAQSSGEVIGIWRSWRGVFSAYERYQVLFGLEDSLKIRPVVRDLFTYTNEKLAWIKERKIDTPVLKEVYVRIEQQYDLIKLDAPIPQASKQKNPPPEQPKREKKG
ncbi:MAG: hypothetical protein A2912_02150 [Candidatus Buchananbacteria bacterium RIFCSPLOWO2_01_FULL_40_23b]|uniref:Uncharacterized protein n=2 Tax=Candidatus Buchananiibacteriota TaxID=1817903 RepID=A0A1G1YPT9_9BACT|nr:MAG: hypothetical protein A2912_02150 [Candidatus Buchananbacteria bacterium RIFCSPLOWO2_01_FULL_40_23b]